MEALEDPNWEQVWILLNDFAQGNSDKRWAGKDPIAYLGETYFLLAQIDGIRKAAIAKHKEK